MKETLNAESKYKNNEEDGKAEHHINQYIIKDEIGRGSFGAVHLAVDQYGQQYVRCSVIHQLRNGTDVELPRQSRSSQNPDSANGHNQIFCVDHTINAVQANLQQVLA